MDTEPRSTERRSRPSYRQYHNYRRRRRGRSIRYERISPNFVPAPDNDPSPQSVIRDLRGQIDDLEDRIDTLESRLLTCRGNVDALEDEKAALEAELVLLRDTEHAKQAYWNDKYPKRDVEYTGRTMPTGTDRISIDVRLFVTPRDAALQNDLSTNDLMVSDPLSVDSDAVAIYKWHQQTFFDRYRYDSDHFGVPELWMFHHELRQVKEGDCDDMANSLASALIAAGIPSWRVRCVAGDVNNGSGGHLTVYVLDDTLDTWRHLNSTTNYGSISGKTSLTQFPTSSDGSDGLGIGNVWFSFNDRYAWNKFVTDVAASNIVVR